MTEESLKSIPMAELAALARSEGFEVDGAADRATLTEFILENLRERKREQEEENDPSVRVEESKYQITESESLITPDPGGYSIEDRYNQTRIVFMVRDPHWAFAYWDLEDRLRETLPADEEAHQLVLRVLNQDSAAFCFDIPIRPDDASWYIYLPDQNRSYVLELGILSLGKYRCLAKSKAIGTPRETFSSRLPDDEPSSAFDLLAEFGGYQAAGASGAIPQRILAAGGE